MREARRDDAPRPDIASLHRITSCLASPASRARAGVRTATTRRRIRIDRPSPRRLEFTAVRATRARRGPRGDGGDARALAPGLAEFLGMGDRAETGDRCLGFFMLAQSDKVGKYRAARQPLAEVCNVM